MGDGRKRLTDVEALEVLARREGDVNFIGRRVRARTEELDGEGRDLAGLKLHWGRRGVTRRGEEAKNDGKGEGFHDGLMRGEGRLRGFID